MSGIGKVMRPLLFVLLALSLTSCHALRSRLHRHGKPADKQDLAPKGTTIVGSVEMVNPDAQFVIVRLASNVSLAADSELISVNEEGKQTKLKVTPERKGLFVTADVEDGEPHQGDIVVRTAAAAEAAAEAVKAEAPSNQEVPPPDFSNVPPPNWGTPAGGPAPLDPLPLPTPAQPPPQGNFLRVVPPSAPSR